MNLEFFLKIITFAFIIIIGLLSSHSVNCLLGPSMLSLLIILSAYTLLLVLPITKFKLSPSGFEGELARLAEKSIPASPTTEKEINQQIETFSANTVEPDLLFMRLSIEIETTLRDLAINAGMSYTKVGIGRLVQFLRQKEIITDSWLIKAISFISIYRNELVHEGKTRDIEKGIEVGKNVLAVLKDINI